MPYLKSSKFCGALIQTIILVGFLSFSLISYAQSTLKDLLQKVEANYPAIQAQKKMSEAAKEGIKISKVDALPSLDAAYQLNYATFNNISGQASPLAWIPISGPPSSTNKFGGIFGSTLGLLANWQPITFGQRQFQINRAESEFNLVLADEQNTIYLQQSKVINAYLDYMYAQSFLAINQENIDRLTIQFSQARALASAGLRPGVDTALVKSELSKAKVDLMQTQNAVRIKSIILSELSAEQNINSTFDSTFYIKIPSQHSGNNIQSNPVLAFGKQYILRLESQKKILETQWYPKLHFLGTLYGRGSGVNAFGEVNSINGLGLSRFNYGFAAQISMPLLSKSKINIQVKQQDYLIQAAQSNLSQSEWQLSKEKETANALFQNAHNIAEEMPMQLESARYAYDAMQSRYDAGLVNYTDLLQVQYNLTLAQMNSYKARFELWKALLYQSTIAGDLNIFLNEY